MKNEILRMEKVTQIIDGITFLDNFNLHIFEGEIMGLLCINAHGKEALIQLLYQNIPIHYGRVYFEESLVNNYEHSSMSMNPVAVIENKSRLIENLTISDNIFVLNKGFKDRIINMKILNEKIKILTEELGIEIDSNEIVDNLNIYQKSVVEILKAVVSNVKLIILRDISSFIGINDLQKIYSLVKYFSRKGISFLYICNDYEEAFKICDRISIMKNGKVLKVLNKNEYSEEKIIPYTIDYSEKEYILANRKLGSEILRFENVKTESINNISFNINSGECVVFLDKSNTIFSDLIKLMNKEIKPISGKIMFNGFDYIKNYYKLKKNICFIQENPIQSMLFKSMNYIDNLCFLLHNKNPFLWIKKGIIKSVIQEYEPIIGEDIYENNISNLTPQSLYNLIYYRIHLYNPKVVFCIQPFSGIDIYLKQHLIKLINKIKEKKITVIILTVNLSESFSVADRLIVIEQGRLCKEYQREEFYNFS